MTEKELKNRSNKIVDKELINDILQIKSDEEFVKFVEKLNKQNLPNDTEYEYYNAAYYQLYGEESNNYKEKLI